jgi:hypothetical protein
MSIGDHAAAILMADKVRDQRARLEDAKSNRMSGFFFMGMSTVMAIAATVMIKVSPDGLFARVDRLLLMGAYGLSIVLLLGGIGRYWWYGQQVRKIEAELDETMQYLNTH